MNRKHRATHRATGILSIHELTRMLDLPDDVEIVSVDFKAETNALALGLRSTKEDRFPLVADLTEPRVMIVNGPGAFA